MKTVFCSLLLVCSLSLTAQKETTISGLFKANATYKVLYHKGKIYVNYLVKNNPMNASENEFATKVLDATTLTEDKSSGTYNDYGGISLFYDLLVGRPSSGRNGIRICHLPTGDVQEYEIQLTKGWQDQEYMVYDAQHNRYYIFVYTSESHYWTEAKSENYLLVYDVAGKTLERREFATDPGGISLLKPLSTDVFDDMLVFQGLKKGKTYPVVVNLATGDVNAIAFDTEVKGVLETSVLQCGEATYVIAHTGRVSSEGSYFYKGAEYFLLDHASHTARHTVTIPTASGPGGYDNRFPDANARRMDMFIRRTGENTFYTYQVENDDVFSYLFHDNTIEKKLAYDGKNVGSNNVYLLGVEKGIVQMAVEEAKRKYIVEINGITGEVMGQETVNVWPAIGSKWYETAEWGKWLKVAYEKGTLTIGVQ